MEREFQIHRTEGDYAAAETWRWILAFVIGVTMGILGFMVDWGIGALNNFKYFNAINVIVTTRAWHGHWVCASLALSKATDCDADRRLLGTLCHIHLYQPGLCPGGCLPGVICGAFGSWKRHCRGQDVPQWHPHQGPAHGMTNGQIPHDHQPRS